MYLTCPKAFKETNRSEKEKAFSVINFKILMVLNRRQIL
jgi:hypothetical protein